mmetsp:Transcript_45206/g.78376  ORF Transcript_45206/g.78376 Transcript_45206/m.78376 type:complete len:351 (+) Transcript_45206:29-1081(+)
MSLVSSEPQNRRWVRRLRQSPDIPDGSCSADGAEQLKASGQSRRWGPVAHELVAELNKAVRAPSFEEFAEEQEQLCVDEQQSSGLHEQRAHSKDQQIDKALALRAAQEAQSSAQRAGMRAKVETQKTGAIQTSVLGGEAFYLPEWFCQDQDRTMYQCLRRELHMHIGPFRGKSLGLAGTQAILEECPMYMDIVVRLVKHFDVEACYSVVNFYQDGSHGIGAHTDSLFMGTNMTIGASFGDPRELVFDHKYTQQRFEFPQRNGDVFAFTDVANRAFRHSVPKTKERVGGRLSIIVWARQGGFRQVSLQTVVMPSEQDIKEAGGDWNRAQQLAVTKLTSGEWKRAKNENGNV